MSKIIKGFTLDFQLECLYICLIDMSAFTIVGSFIKRMVVEEKFDLFQAHKHETVPARKSKE